MDDGIHFDLLRRLPRQSRVSVRRTSPKEGGRNGLYDDESVARDRGDYPIWRAASSFPDFGSELETVNGNKGDAARAQAVPVSSC